jgi:hypothetical protein
MVTPQANSIELSSHAGFGNKTLSENDLDVPSGSEKSRAKEVLDS